MFQKHGQRVFLEPANKTYPLIVPQKRMRLAAVVIAVIRKYQA